MGEACGMYGGVHLYRVTVVRLEKRRPLGRPRDRWENKSHRNLKRLEVSLWNGLIWHSIRKNDRCTEHGNEKTCSVKIEEFPDSLRN